MLTIKSAQVMKDTYFSMLKPPTKAHSCLLYTSGGEGKSQIGAVLGALFGSNMKDGSIGKISENRFARADLEQMCIRDSVWRPGGKPYGVGENCTGKTM